MRNSRYYSIAAILVLFAFSPAIRPANISLTHEVIAKIETLVAREMDQNKIPGLSIAIAVNNKLQYAKGFGMADLENSVPATEATVYRTASIAKAMTATAVMQLAERSKIDLDAPIQRYCSAFPPKQWPVTARLLLGHLGGIRHYKNGQESVGTAHYQTIVDSLTIFKDEPLLYEPGTKYNYTTFGYSVLGCAVEGASGMSYEDYMRQHIFQNAGMNHTGIDNSQRLIPGRAHGYSKINDKSSSPAAKNTSKIDYLKNAALHDTSMKVPGGGLVSTSVDLAKFAIALNTGLLVNDRSRDQMWTRQKLKDGTLTSYGLGWGISQTSLLKTVSHSGGQAGTSTYLVIIPEKGLAISIMSNLEGFAMERFTRDVIQIILATTPKNQESSRHN